MRISVASGKGGTGKTLVAVSLARLYAEQGRAVSYVDADAEAPNGHLFLTPRIESEESVTVRVPLLVAEPTPFGMHDLQLAIEMGRALDKRMAVVINRADLGDAGVDDLLSRFEIPVLARIPFDRSVAECYAAGGLPVVECESFRGRVLALAGTLLEVAG